MLKKLFILVLFVMFGLCTFAQTQNYQDVVYLKNGSVIKGVIIEQIPNVSLKIETDNGSTFICDMKDVTKLAKEKIIKKTETVEQTPIAEEEHINRDSISTTISSYRSPALAGWLSFLMPGVGQFYNGQPGMGVCYLLWHTLSFGIIYYGINESYYSYKRNNNWETHIVLGASSALLSWIISIIDANVTAKEINKSFGFTSINLSNKANLSFNPEIKPLNKQINSGYMSYGLNIKLSF